MRKTRRTKKTKGCGIKVKRRTKVRKKRTRVLRVPSVKNTLTSILDKRPRVLTDLLKREGDQQITNIEVCRVPVTGILQKLANLMTIGKFKRELKRMGYDTVFHLYLVVYLANGKVYSLEKNQRVNIISGKKSGTCKNQAGGIGTLREFIMNAESKNIPGFYRYDAFTDNCQKWVYDILNCNGITQFNSFVLQKVDTLAPSIFKKILRGITDTAGLIDWAIRG